MCSFLADWITCFQSIAALAWAVNPCRNADSAGAFQFCRPQGEEGHGSRLEGGAGHAGGVGGSKRRMTASDRVLTQLGRSGVRPGTCKTSPVFCVWYVTL